MAGLDPAIHENTESCNQANDLLAKPDMARNGAGAAWMAGALAPPGWRVKPGHDAQVPVLGIPQIGGPTPNAISATIFLRKPEYYAMIFRCGVLDRDCPATSNLAGLSCGKTL
jgi:hypothetical protein